MSGSRFVRRRAVGPLCALLLLAGCASSKAPRNHEKLDAVLWMRTSAEWAASVEQAYGLARIRLDESLLPANKRSWTASTEQTGDFASLPPAVIVDIDEALLDTSDFQKALVTGPGEFDIGLWNAWVQEADAHPLPGAVDFLNYARKRGVHVFYVSNRSHEVEKATRENLRKRGFPLEPDGDIIFSKDEQPEWKSDKTTRRAHIAEEYRIVLIVGDDMNDFVSGSKTDPASRREVSRRYASWWGKRWILLPNPIYGDWERSLYRFERDLSREQILERKYEALDGAGH